MSQTSMPQALPYKTRAGFTLVELLVVIGIIGLLVAILLPTLSRARETANTAACLSNQRQIGIALRLYNNDNQDYMPWGKWGANAEANPAPARALDKTTWITSVGQYMGNIEMFQESNQPLRGEFPDVFSCPSVDGDIDRMRWDYAANPVIMPDVYYEIAGRASNPSIGGLSDRNLVVGPPKSTGLFPDNVVVWDMVKYPFDPISTDGIWRNFGPGVVYGFTGLDDFNLAQPLLPEGRYRFTGRDPFENDPSIGQAFPAQIEGPDSSQGHNFDVGAYPAVPTNFNSVRWRHNGDTVANFVFADGSARGLRLSPDTPHPDRGDRFCTSELMRKNLRIKLPGNLQLP